MANNDVEASVASFRQAAKAKRHAGEMSAHLAAIVDASEEAVVSVTLDGVITVWNRCAETLYGYEAAEAVGQPLSLLMPPDRLNELAPMLASVGTGERIDHFETVRVRKDGTHVNVATSIFPIRDASGAVIGAASIAKDITERMRMEDELRHWKDRLQAIVQGVDDAVVVRGPGGEVVYANDNAARLLGFNSVAELTANPVAHTHSRFEFYTESGEPVPTGKLPGMLALQGNEVPPTVVHFRLLSTGEERWAIVKAVPIKDEQGRVNFAVSIFSDITEQRQAEEEAHAGEARFQAFMRNSPIVAFIKDEEARFVYVNPQFERAFQTTADRLLGVRDTQLVHGEVARRIHRDDAEVLATGRLKEIVEVIPAPDGTLHHWLTFKFPITDPSGRRFIAGAAVEITERVAAEVELQRYAQRLRTLSQQLIEAQEAERRRIASDLHDQVGQSLTAIKIEMQIARHQAKEADRHPAPGAVDEAHASHSTLIERLDKGIDMVERTIQQVREFSLDLRPSILDDLGLPSALLWYAEEQAHRAGFETELAIEQLQTRLSPELEIICFRIAQEAITNVVRHAHASRVAVQLRGHDGELVLTVKDDGTGFDARTLTTGLAGSGSKRTQGPKSKVQSPKSKERINALGITGMHERMLLVGGTLSIESAPGEGTTVRATFPLAAPSHGPGGPGKQHS